MTLNQILNPLQEGPDYERDNFDTLEKTGFWGKAGAGCIIMDRQSKEFLLPFRSRSVEQPHTWGTWGGAIDGGISPEEAVRNEVQEEAGYHGQLELVPLYVFKHASGFRYFNFLAIVDGKFKPTLNWETEKFGWFPLNKFPSPLHFGLQGILNDTKSMSIIENHASE